MIFQYEIDTLRKAADELERKQREYIEKSKGYYIALDILPFPEYGGGIRKITTVDLIGRRTPESAEALCEENKKKCVRVSPETYEMLIELHYILKTKHEIERLCCRNRERRDKIIGLRTHIIDVIEGYRQMMKDLGFEKEICITINRLS